MAIETIYKSGTITAINADGTIATQLDNAESSTTNEEVGRIFYITSDTDTYQGRYRRITANTSTQGGVVTFTIDQDFASSTDTVPVSPFRALVSNRSDADGFNATNERPIAVGDTFTVSKPWSEVAEDNADVTAVAGAIKSYIVGTGGIEVPSGVVIYDELAKVEWDYQTDVDIQNGSAVIFGRQNFGDQTDGDINGYPSHSCELVDTSSSFISGTRADRGALHMNGGSFRGTATSGNGTFYRYYRDLTNSDPEVADERQSFRFWNVNISGKFGGRVSGNYSVFFGNTSSGNDSQFGILNPLSMSVFQDNSALGNSQGVYISTQLGGSTTVGALTMQDIIFPGSDTTTAIFNINSNTGGTTQTILNWDIGAIDALTQDTNVRLNKGNTNTSIFEWVKDYELNFTNTDGTAITDINGKARFHDTTDTVTDAGTIDSALGIFDSQRLLAYRYSVNGVRQNFQATGVTQSTPYTWSALFRNSGLVIGSTDLENGAATEILQTFPIVADANILEEDTSLVDAYTEFLNSRDAYDYMYKFKEDNMELPTLQTVPFTLSGDTITPTEGSDAFIFDSAQTGVPLQYASNVWTMTTPSTGFLGGVSTTGDVTVDTTIKGDITAATINHVFTDGEVIMDGDITVSGEITLADGTYELIDADYGGCTFTASGSAVTLISIGGTGSPTLNTGVSLTKQVEFIVELEGDDTYTAADTTLAAFEYTTDGTLVGTELTQTSLTPDNDNNQFAVTYSVDPDNVVRFACNVDGYKTVNGESGAQETIALELYLTNLMNKDAVSDNTTVQTSVDALIDGMTVTWDATNEYVDYQFANDDALTADITDAETRNFIYILSKDNVFLSRVARQDIPPLTVDFNLAGIVVELNSADTPIPFVHFSKASGGTSAIEPNSQVVDEGNNDQAAVITNTPDDEKVRFNKKATVVLNTNANLEAAANELKDIYLNDGDVQERQEEISQIIYFKP